MQMTATALSVLLCATPVVAAAQTPVTHAPLGPGVELQVRSYVREMAATFAAFYPQTEFRNVRAVYFRTGAVIVCGELNRVGETGRALGWRYFSNSGPLIFESDKQETLCDQRTYQAQALTDDHEYGPEFTQAAQR